MLGGVRESHETRRAGLMEDLRKRCANDASIVNYPFIPWSHAATKEQNEDLILGQTPACARGKCE